MGALPGANGSLAIPPLDGLVLDLTTELGWLCGKILAELGAEVVKVEPPGGDAGRDGAAWLAYNVGKRSLELDLATPAGREELRDLAAEADFLLESFPPGQLDRLGLGWEALSARNPSLVMASITPYGQEGPLAGVPASDLELMAASGALWLAGDADRPPVRISLPQAACWAGAHAAAGALIAHHFRERTGRGQHVDVSAQASLLPAIVHAPLFWQLLGEVPRRSGPLLTGRNVHGAAFRNVWRCRDGWVTFALYGGAVGRGSNRALVDWMAERAMAPGFLREVDWERFDVATVTQEEISRMEGAIAPFLATLSKREFSRGAVQRRILGYAVATVADLAEDEQLAAREAWQELGGRRHPSGWARFDGRPARPAEAPRAPRGTRGRATSSDFGGRGALKALDDLRVVEFGGFAAGPHVGKHLADHGAEVVHVESHLRLDGFRTNYPPFKEGTPGVERAGMFAMTHNDKLGVTLNLKTPAGADLARRLVARSDVVIENFTPGTMAELGLGYQRCAAENPRLVMLSTCNQGQTGPRARHPGFGTQLTALSGFINLTGWPDRDPSLLWGPYIDYIAVAYGVVGVLAALDQRRRTGRGCHVDLSQYETGLQFMAPALLDFFATGAVAERRGNRDPVAVPHGVYPCLGEERFVALSVHDDAEWARLRRALGDPAWAGDAGLDAAAGRRAREDELDRRLAAWTAGLAREDVVERLRGCGVRAAPVNDMADLVQDPQLGQRRAWRPVEHPVLGRFPAVGPPWLLSGTPAEISGAAPLLGQHNREVFCGLLGLGEDEYRDLEGAGVFE